MGVLELNSHLNHFDTEIRQNPLYPFEMYEDANGNFIFEVRGKDKTFNSYVSYITTKIGDKNFRYGIEIPRNITENSLSALLHGSFVQFVAKLRDGSAKTAEMSEIGVS